MIKKTLNYTDFDGNQLSDDFHFNLSKAELIEMELGEQDGMQKKLNRIVEAKDNVAIMAVFKDIILRSYGVRSEDKKRFIKSKQLSEEFSQTDAYSELLWELLRDEDKAAAFMNGLLPTSLMEEVNKEIEAKQPQDFQKRKVSLAELQGGK